MEPIPRKKKEKFPLRTIGISMVLHFLFLIFIGFRFGLHIKIIEYKEPKRIKVRIIAQKAEPKPEKKKPKTKIDVKIIKRKPIVKKKAKVKPVPQKKKQKAVKRVKPSPVVKAAVPKLPKISYPRNKVTSEIKPKPVARKKVLRKSKPVKSISEKKVSNIPIIPVAKPVKTSAVLSVKKKIEHKVKGAVLPVSLPEENVGERNNSGFQTEAVQGSNTDRESTGSPVLPKGSADSKPAANNDKPPVQEAVKPDKDEKEEAYEGPGGGIDPEFPEDAKERGESGTVVVVAEILASGKAGQIKIEKSSGYESLDRTVIETVRSSRFKPARRGGRAVSSKKRFVVNFELEDPLE